MPIIFVTAFPDDTLRAQIKHLGTAVLLPKPFQAEEMLSLIRERLPHGTPTSDYPAWCGGRPSPSTCRLALRPRPRLGR